MGLKMGKQQLDKRKKRRIALQILVSYSYKDEKIDNFSYNFSTGGMFIETKNVLPLGSHFKIFFESPIKRTSIEVEAEVMWCSKDKKPFGMGVEFKNFTDDKRKILNEMAEDLSEAS